MPVIVAACFFQGMYYVFVNIAFYYKKSIYIMKVSVLSALINIMLNYICIRVFGYLAAAYTTMVTNILMCLMHYHNISRICSQKIFGGWRYIGLAVICIVWLLVTQIFIKSIVIKCLICFIVLLMILFNRKKIICSIKEFITH